MGRSLFSQRLHVVSHLYLSSFCLKIPPAMRTRQDQSLGLEDPLEESTATCSSILAWRIPWTEEPGSLYSPWGHRVGHDWSDWAHSNDLIDALFCLTIVIHFVDVRKTEPSDSSPAGLLVNSVDYLTAYHAQGRPYLMKHNFHQEKWLSNVGTVR